MEQVYRIGNVIVSGDYIMVITAKETQYHEWKITGAEVKLNDREKTEVALALMKEIIASLEERVRYFKDQKRKDCEDALDNLKRAYNSLYYAYLKIKRI